MVGASRFHEPVLVEEALGHWVTDAEGCYLDGTVGGGGHAHRLLERYPRARLVGLDLDPAAIAAAEEHLRPFGGRVRLVRSNFAEMEAVLASLGGPPIRGIFLDLGVSSHQIDDPARGFSYLQDGPLRMTLDRDAPRGARELLAAVGEDEVKGILSQLGELPGAGRAARAIVEARREDRLQTTADLARALRRGGVQSPRRLSQAFQAVRLLVNRELESLRLGLDASARVLPAGGTLTVISFESLMDRVVKETIRPPRRERPHPGLAETPLLWAPLTRKVVRPAPLEVAQNPRSRSARLRAARRSSHV